MGKAEENAEVVRRGYAAFNAADMKALTEIFPTSASWHTPGRSRIAGDHKGREAAFGQFGRYVGETGGTFKATLLQLTRSDDGCVVGIDGPARGRARSQTLHARRSMSVLAALPR